MTYESIPYARPLGPPMIADNQRGWLIAFGICGVLIGTAPALLVLAVGWLSVTFGGLRFMGAREVLAATFFLAVNLFATTLLIWMGVASIRCRRWMRPMAIAVGWIGAIGSAFFLCVISPGLMREMNSSRPDWYIALLFYAMVVVAGVMFPIIVIWFYSTDAVKRTFGAYNPGLSWTERCPLPVMVGCFGLLCAGTATIGTSFEAVTPFFGRFIEGDGAASLAVAAGVIMLVAALFLYQMLKVGWWLAMAVIVLGFASALITFFTVGADDLHHQLGTGPADGVGVGMAMTLSIMAAAICVGYLLWVRKYIHRSAELDAR
jgi:hypothetical protein